MKPRIKAFSLAVLASLGLMGGCRNDNEKIENLNVEVSATLEETPEPTEIVTSTPTVVPTEVPTPEPTPTPTPTVEPTAEPTPEPTIEPTVEPKDEMPRISLVGEINLEDFKGTIILDPQVHLVVTEVQKLSNEKFEDGWTNGEFIIPYLPDGYGYAAVAVDEENKNKPYIWAYSNVDSVEKNLNTRTDMYNMITILDPETKTYEEYNRIMSVGSFGKVYEKSEDYSYYENLYGKDFYQPQSHVVYYVCDYSEIFDMNGNFIFEIPEGYDVIGAIDLESGNNVNEIKSSGKVALFFTNYVPILVEENVKMPGTALIKEQTLTLHL